MLLILALDKGTALECDGWSVGKPLPSVGANESAKTIHDTPRSYP